MNPGSSMWIDLGVILGVLTLALLSPGPDFMLVVKNSVGGNARRAAGTVIGIGAGLAVQMALISFGFATISPQIAERVQIIGAGVLAWIGLRAVFAAGGENVTEDPVRSKGVRSGFSEGLICNLLNPKAFLFFVSLFAQALHVRDSAVWRIVLPVTIVLHGVACWGTIAYALQSPPVARRLGRAQRWLPRVFGGVLVVVAAALLWDGLAVH